MSSVNIQRMYVEIPKIFTNEMSSVRRKRHVLKKAKNIGARHY